MTKKSTRKILIVEDEVVIALRLQKRLSSMGFDITGVAYSGEEAVEKAKSLRPDLILMDIMLQGKMDGIVAAKIINAELDIPVVFLTAFSEDNIIEGAKHAEPYGFILKPFQDREIKAAIEIALYKKEMEKALQESEEALKKSHNELERRVNERTFQLNNALKTIKQSEAKLIQRKLSLEKLNKELLETNQALSVLARNIDKNKELLEKKIYEIIIVKIMPIIEELQDDKSCQKRLADLEVLKTYLNNLISGSTDHHDIIVCLSSQEIRVAALIKHGLTSQKIANMLNISLHTVKTHRKNIRKKLEIQNSKINLTSYLSQNLQND
jgi:DNA-binding NarL/FixJ family response regulator